MALSQKLELRQSQALVMTPQLMQAIKLLQLSNLDLAAYVEAEIERNPLLERVDDPERAHSADEAGAETGGESEEAASAAAEAPAVESVDAESGDAPSDEADAARPRAADGPGYSEWAGVGAGGREDNDYNLEAFVS